ncbi:MAG: phage tail assembly protein [Caldicoprobacter oshimai]
MNTFKLSKPIMIDGKEVSELPYDFEAMTAKDKIEVGKIMKNLGIPIAVAEIDPDYHLYLFAKAVTKADPSITISDVMRMSAKDADRAAALARNFFYLDSEG